MKVSCALQFTPICGGRGPGHVITVEFKSGTLELATDYADYTDLIRVIRGPHDRLRDNKSMIWRLPPGEFRLYSRKKDPKTGRSRNLGTFETREAAEKHERAVQLFKRQ
jgi:hypothetical protein